MPQEFREEKKTVVAKQPAPEPERKSFFQLERERELAAQNASNQQRRNVSTKAISSDQYFGRLALSLPSIPSPRRSLVLISFGEDAESCRTSAALQERVRAYGLCHKGPIAAIFWCPCYL